MAADDLTRPLGLTRARTTNRGRLYGLVAGTAAVAVMAAAAYIVGATPAPTVTATINVPPPAAPNLADRTAAIAPAADPNEPPITGLQEITTSGGVVVPSSDRVVIHDPSEPLPITLAALPDEALVEQGAYGPLPRVGADGLRPLQAYARPYTDRGDALVAIVVGGIGIDPASSERAIDDLPGAVTLAFAPYGEDLDAWLRSARTAGHEILLQIPLEPYSYPSIDPGPHTLTTDSTADENLDRLHWLMSRITTYVGVVNYMGARFTSEPPALAPILEDVGRRGLVYVDDGSSPRSQASVAASGRTPFVKADIVLDADLSSAAIDARLESLLETARERGYAVATATAFPVTIDRIAAFARVAADRGVMLVPVSALAGSAPR